TRYGMDIIWIGASVITALVVLFIIPARSWSVLAWWGYLFVILLLIAVLFIGTEIKGSKSWISLGYFNLQPAEFSKISTAVALAALMGKYGFSFRNKKDAVAAILTILIPMALILLEKETGSMLVYLAFVFVFYREGFSGWFIMLGALFVVLFIMTLVVSPYFAILLIAGIFGLLWYLHYQLPIYYLLILAAVVTLLAFFPRLLQIEAIAAINPFPAEIWIAGLMLILCFIFSIRTFLKKRGRFLFNSLLAMICSLLFVLAVEPIFNNLLGAHQRTRIEDLLGIIDDPMGVGYNVNQSMIAIGSGGFTGKGFLNGTQTRFDFVPEQETDFIFCTIGEEWGFIGAMFVLILYFVMITRIISSAEKNKENFTRIYGYCVAMCITVHVVINICMTIGMMPVIGIPLPFLSYGGSSLIAFTLLLFIFVRLDLERWN
ncbi:MAG: rod shape-determining protein RodA, partial [Bacteroidales bacterium]|nr:rod shape-determining protein RodA [Bacteroidales bacterium]